MNVSAPASGSSLARRPSLSRGLTSLLAALCLIALPALAATYTDNGNGTVTDPNTGLSWKRCAEGQTWTGSACGGTASFYTWNQAMGLTGTSSFAGRSDWRLPNIRELQTIVDRARYGPVLDPAAFPGAPSAYAWSASPLAANTNNAWKLHLSGGLTSNAGQAETNAVFLVRADTTPGAMNPARPASDYLDNADGTVTHLPTGLMWQRCATGQAWTGAGCSGVASAVPWAQASGLTDSFAGKTDWRLPTEDELLSLVDYTLGAPALNTGQFPGTPTASFWSATLNFLHSNNAWETSFTDGHAIANSPTTSALHVRLVRSAAARPNLLSGWNLAGNSSTGPVDAAAAFGDATKVVSVWKWVTSSAKWAFYTPSLAGQALTDYTASKGYEALTTINGGEGFWVNAKAAFTAQLPAGAAITSTSLQAMPSGWNLVAIGDNKTPSQFNASAGAGTSFTTLWAWDALQANWYFYAPSLDAGGGLNAYITTKGYLDFGANNKKLGAGEGFWVNKP